MQDAVQNPRFCFGKSRSICSGGDRPDYCDDLRHRKYGKGSERFSGDPKLISREELTRRIITYGLQVPGGFVYLPEGYRAGERKIEIAILGPDDELLKRLARHSAGILSEEPWVSQVILHFKDGPPAWVFRVDHDKAPTSGIRASDIAGTLRWALHGPVALKWIENNHEIDLRVMARRRDVDSISKLGDLPIKKPAEGRIPTGTRRAYRAFRNHRE
ncbi:hypothetical protein ES705_41140 [subsurface metagenome]